MFMGHCVKTYSQSQETSALSSGESEFYGIVETATMGFGEWACCRMCRCTRARVQLEALRQGEGQPKRDAH
jgi:hypothetical protein